MTGSPPALAVEQGLPLAHITVGQKVPEDILPAEPHALAASALNLDPLLAESLL